MTLQQLKLSCILLLASCFAVQTQAQVFKVERLVSPRSDTYGENNHGLSPSLAQFGISSTTQGSSALPFPNRDEFENILLIGTDGIAVKTAFVEFERNCEYLCGDELEECHYSGLVSWQEPDIGVPLLAVTGLNNEVTGFRSYIDTPPLEINDISIMQQELVWPLDNHLGISTKAGETHFTYRYQNDYTYEYSQPVGRCRIYAYEATGLSRLSCDGAEVLLEGEVPLLYSNADYNLPNAQLVNEFLIGEQRYFTVMLALKAYTAYGLLVMKDGKWQFLVKPADWAQLC